MQTNLVKERSYKEDSNDEDGIIKSMSKRLYEEGYYLFILKNSILIKNTVIKNKYKKKIEFVEK